MVLASANSASLTLNATGASLAGGTTAIQLNNSGARLVGIGGGPATLTGIAAGSNDFDAVNYRQFRDSEKMLSRGIASATALANIPQVDTAKRFAIGAGVASFNSETSFAIGASARFANSGVVKASVGTGSSGKAAYGLGAGWSF